MGSEKIKSFATRLTFSEVEIHADTGMLSGVQLCQVGEAKGHGVMLEQSFVDDVVRLCNEKGDSGMKCRFGHPSICMESLGTYLGRFYNARVEGNKAVADLYLDPIAKNSPNGDIYTYVLQMSEKNPDMFGCSIVFEDGGEYRRDENGEVVEHTDDRYYDLSGPIYQRIAALDACDVVDDPAATDGFYSSRTYAVGVELSKFFDEFPQVFQMLEKEAPIRRFLETKIPEARGWFAAYRAHNQQLHQPVMKKEVKLSAKAEAAMRKLGRLKYDISAETADGVNIIIVTSADQPAIGDAVQVVAEDGSTSPAPDGTHVINGGDLDGYVIETVSGAITSVVAPEVSPAEGDPALSAEQKYAALKSEFEAFKRQSRASATPPGGSDPGRQQSRPVQPWNVEGEKAYNDGRRRRGE